MNNIESLEFKVKTFLYQDDLIQSDEINQMSLRTFKVLGGKFNKYGVEFTIVNVEKDQQEQILKDFTWSVLRSLNIRLAENEKGIDLEGFIKSGISNNDTPLEKMTKGMFHFGDTFSQYIEGSEDNIIDADGACTCLGIFTYIDKEGEKSYGAQAMIASDQHEFITAISENFLRLHLNREETEDGDKKHNADIAVMVKDIHLQLTLSNDKFEDSCFSKRKLVLDKELDRVKADLKLLTIK